MLGHAYHASAERAVMAWNPTRNAVTVIDGFEDGDIAEYRGEPDEYSVVNDSSGAYDGDYYLRHQLGSSGRSQMYSDPGDGLNAYFAKGETAKFYFRASESGDSKQFFVFGVADGNLFKNAYEAGLRWAVSPPQLRLNIDSDKENQDTLDSEPIDTWVELTLAWDDGTLGGADNDIRLTAAVDGSQIGSVSINDSTYATETGVGFRVDTGGGVAKDIDYIHKP